MRFEYERLHSELKIDENRLEEACKRQSELFHEVAREAALCTSERDEWKETLADIEAEVDQEVREDMAKHDEKVTEREVATRVRLDRRVSKARKKLLDWKRQASTTEALEKSFYQRSYMLTQLTTLFVASYYGDGSPKRLAEKVKTERADHNREVMNTMRKEHRDRL